ncbi:MAG: BrnT family toxin [Verrucomicrobia bacterium]|nr:BrnT family toxin [Verrucomicrobiota bacterium]
MPFEYDPAKSQANKVKLGIDFEEAQRLRNDESALEGKTPYAPEERCYRIGGIGRACWTAIFIYRQGQTRLSSVRRAQGSEKAANER